MVRPEIDLEEETRFHMVPGWQREVLEERLKDVDCNPDDEQSWEEVKAEL